MALAELQRRSCEVLGHSLVQHPAALSLRRLGSLLLANLLRLQALWRSAISGDKTAVLAMDEVDRLMAGSHRLLDIVVSQLALCTATYQDAMAVLEWGNRLIGLEYVKFHALLPLVDRVCDDVRRKGDLEEFTPVSGLSLTAMVEAQPGGDAAAIFVDGLMTARALALAFRDDRRLADRLPVMILAALLQDVGKASIGVTPAPQHAAWHDRQHPAIGAALCGSIRGAPPELPLIIAQHHERFDGTGFPRVLRGSDLLPQSAIVAATTRFAELCLATDDASSRCENFSDSISHAAHTLVAEAEWGKWKLEIGRRIASRVAEEQGRGDLPARANSGKTSAGRAVPVHDSDRSLQLHGLELSLQGGHAEHDAGTVSKRPNALPWRDVQIPHVPSGMMTLP
ncbi:MAG: hypothetical protein HY290_15560 [Planctomycetia bacterium]|nr:hypothetical protein [Planctomycetia bacterium]